MSELRRENERLRLALEPWLTWFDAAFPKGQNERLPGARLYAIAEQTRSVLAGGQLEQEGERVKECDTCDGEGGWVSAERGGKWRPCPDCLLDRASVSIPKEQERP